MSLDTDDEILQDFLIEAGELLDGLSEQLVELERNPTDRDLLNAVFRSFHTIKGGAGFLNLNHLVAVCHRAEDVFNVLRQGQRQVDSTLMDAVLQVLDVVTRMFNETRAGEEPGPADPALLSLLESMSGPDDGDAPVSPSVVPAASPSPLEPEPLRAATAGLAAVSSGEGDITDEEFEALLDAMQAGGPEPVLPGPGSAGSDSDEITEDEFEQLLDELHGKSAFPGAGGGGGDLITEDEFDELLDQLHGRGAAPKSGPTASPVSTEPPLPPARAAAAGSTGAGATSSGHAAPAHQKTTSQQPAAETSVRVDTRRLDDIMNLVGELVLVRNRLATLRAKLGDEQVAKAVSNLDVVTADLQSAVMKTRMQPIKKVFGRFPRVVRDLARNLNKEINLELRGEDTDLDKNLVEALADPLVHLVRNAVDHGVESPQEREAAGKPRVGHVVLSAEQEGDHILLTISDDGKGMDPEALRRKAVEKGLMDEDSAMRMSDQDAYNVIFMAGFSTKTEISDVSGRGVGMDVVKTRIAQLNGRIEIESAKGKGSTLRIKVPLTLAILPTLMVVLGEQRFALPLANVSEIFDLDLSRTNRVDDQEVVMVRNQAMPLYYLRRWLAPNAPPRTRTDTQHVVMVFVGNRRVGLVVDSLIGQEEVVIKPLGSSLHGLPGFAGATITGDGGIALILDVPGLLRTYARRF